MHTQRLLSQKVSPIIAENKRFSKYDKKVVIFTENVGTFNIDITRFYGKSLILSDNRRRFVLFGCQCTLLYGPIYYIKYSIFTLAAFQSMW